ncbi:hypothetical protein PR003_g28222 [Phytophthora rubi]|uniref:Uncharacterized protein n=1 Tax=Phytophthora rubi TaxID=129364 RepID=A0A6A3HJA8_9STRA|nr:hypothetical protein PR002_g27330 [Phytophthora rubi]KAE9279489.1 hypothetical protein PR003_g28222 [Phytophthora rubi]
MMGDVDPTLVAMPTVMNPTPKPKKFYFTPAKDLDLLMEVVNETELCARTVKERFFRLVNEFKDTDCAYRKKSGVEEEYTEHKRLLQDVVDELKGVEAKKKKKKAGQQAKSDRLESDGEILREQALKRRSQRGTPVQSGEVASNSSDASADETSERSSDTASSTTTTSTRGSGYQAGGGFTTAQVNAATVEFIAKQSKRHEDEYQLLGEELSVKQTKRRKLAGRRNLSFTSVKLRLTLKSGLKRSTFVEATWSCVERS